MPHDKKLWILDQLTILGEAFGEALTAERLRIYVEDLASVELPQLAIAFKRARAELKFFPKIAELQTLAGADTKEMQAVEAEGAWQTANRYLEQHGIDSLPTFRGGKVFVPLPLPPRIDYALRRIGGLRGLNLMTEESRPFMRRDFVEAYWQAPLAEQMRPMLDGLLGAKQLEGQVRQLANRIEDVRSSSQLAVTTMVPGPKAIQQPLSEAQCQERREMLRQQATAQMKLRNA